MNTKVVNIRTTHNYDVYIGRPATWMEERKTHGPYGKWGNPFIIGKDGTREEVIEKHRKWLYDRICTEEGFIQKVAALKGKRLGCYCHPEPCHGDTLARAAEWAHEQLTEWVNNQLG